MTEQTDNRKYLFQVHGPFDKMAPDLVKALGAIDAVVKDSKNPFFKSSYASLEAVLAVVKPIYREHNLGLTQWPVEKDGLTTALIHTSGARMESTYFMKPTKAGPQEQVSVISYMKRCAAQAISGLPTTDDDGNAASKGATKVTKKKTMNKTAPSNSGDTFF